MKITRSIVLILAVALLPLALSAQKNGSKACTGCTVTISSAWPGALAVPAGTTICITATGSVTDDIYINGGTLCNEGQITSHNILFVAGTLTNQGQMDVVNLALTNGFFDNQGMAVIDSLSMTSASSYVTNSDTLITLANSLTTGAYIMNYGWYESDYTSLTLASWAENHGVFHAGNLSLADTSEMNLTHILNTGTGLMESDSISLWDAQLQSHGSVVVNYDISLLSVSQLTNFEHMSIGRDIYIDSGSQVITYCMIHVGQNFANFGHVIGYTTSEHCGGFTVAGLSGNYGSYGYSDTYTDMCDLSNPGSFDINTGILGAHVTFCVCADSCVYHASVDESALPELTELTLTPNPADDWVALNFTSHTKGSAFLIVYNMMGDVIYKKELLLNPGENPLELSLESWSNGLYLISIQQAGVRLNAKLIKQ